MSEKQEKRAKPKGKKHEEHLRRQRILSQLSRAPGKCPLGRCEQVVFPSGLLVHLLHRHGHEPNTTVCIVYDDQPLRLNFKLDALEPDVPQSLAILLYAGTENKSETLPARRHLSFPNSGLLNDRRCFEHHLTLVLMICKTAWYAMLPDQQLAAELEEIDNPDNTIYILWVAAPVTANRVFYTMTLFDRYYIQSRSVIRNTRNYIVSQNPRDFLGLESDYLLLRQEEAFDLLGGPEHTRLDDDLPQGIHLELFLHEDLSAKAPESRISKHVLDTYNGSGAKMPRTKMTLDRDAQGKLSLNRKPLSVPMIGGPMGTFPEMVNDHPKEVEKCATNHQDKELATKASKARTKKRGKARPKDLRILKEELKMRPEVTSREGKSRHLEQEESDKYHANLAAKWSKYVLISQLRKAKTKKLMKTMDKYIRICQEANSSASDLEDTLRELAKMNPDQQLAVKGSQRSRSVSPERRRRASHEVAPEVPTGSRVKAGSSQGVTWAAIEEITGIPMRELQQTILNLQIPITREAMETVKETVIKSVGEAVRKVAQEKGIPRGNLRLEEQEKRKPETRDKAKTHTETEVTPKNQAKIHGVECVSLVDCDSSSETCAP
ncbi:uncharacterized protein LOC108023641 [Drosophila biarmipes]|uniref:uncharacterized protein LOC108023641 n=1 Tax=Drosophila biarmipes TaxID=125945 RepID=UPI0007E88F71|nr:uncharacterized protein LOC108023641 [Drosophila biarmipes]